MGKLLDLYEQIKIKTFVAVDIETTGLNADPNKGKVDHIIEVGAVKITEGKIAQKFSSFCAYPLPLSDEIVKLTGVSDNDLLGAPNINNVLRSLFDFCNGYEFVGYNVRFDLSFLQYYGKQTGINFNTDYKDIRLCAKELLKGEVADYKISTLIKYFDLRRENCRSVDRAETAARIFLNLAKTERFLGWLDSIKELD